MAKNVASIKLIVQRLSERRHNAPPELLRLAELGVTKFSPWWMLHDSRSIDATHERLRECFPERRLVAFAHRLDLDDAACFDLDSATPTRLPVVVVHEDTVPGFEVEAEFSDFRAWFRQAVEDFFASITRR